MTTFQRPSLLIVGCGDIGLRVLAQLRGRMRVLALTSDARRVPLLRQAGAVPLLANLDDARSLRRLAGVADQVLHLAPPPAQGNNDPRTRHLLQALARGQRLPSVLVYGSTSGVYGPCAGEWVAETRPVAPASARAMRRVAAESDVRAFGREFGVRTAVLRIPGIYAMDREGGDPRERVARGASALCAADDVYTNHIQADDLARICIAALFRAWPQRVLNASDDTTLRMGDYLDLVADRFDLPRPPRLSWAQAQRELPPLTLSFMAESRRLLNTRLKRELGVRLRYPHRSRRLTSPALAAPKRPLAAPMANHQVATQHAAQVGEVGHATGA